MVLRCMEGRTYIFRSCAKGRMSSVREAGLRAFSLRDLVGDYIRQMRNLRKVFLEKNTENIQ